jgi:hypothetical protein
MQVITGTTPKLRLEISSLKKYGGGSGYIRELLVKMYGMEQRKRV